MPAWATQAIRCPGLSICQIGSSCSILYIPRSPRNFSAPRCIRAIKSLTASPPSSPCQRSRPGRARSSSYAFAALSPGEPCQIGLRISSSHGSITSSRLSSLRIGLAVCRVRSNGETYIWSRCSRDIRLPSSSACRTPNCVSGGLSTHNPLSIQSGCA